MAAWIRARVLLLLSLTSLAGPLTGSIAAQELDNWYPVDISPPAGTQYPCALTALPPGLPGIPSADRRFINHVYSMILKAVQAKLVLQAALDQEKGEALDARFTAYMRTTDEALKKIQAEPVPEGLPSFTADVIQAIKLQRAFFRKAVTARQRGMSLEEVFHFPEARDASGLLLRAWAKMARRYKDAWTPATKDSIYHHLCALDFF
jgi:hypothetical protein